MVCQSFSHVSWYFYGNRLSKGIWAKFYIFFVLVRIRPWFYNDFIPNALHGLIFWIEFWAVYGLLTKCEVKMAGYWPSSFFCVFMDRDEVEVHKLAKNERGQYPVILTEQTWSIKDLLYGFWGNFACGIQRVVPSGQDGSILPARVANHSARFGSSCPLAELAI